MEAIFSPFADFNPRSPHGERLACEESQAVTIDFNPRSPHGERLLGGRAIFAAPHFNPRSPHGERLAPPTVSAPSAVISIHAPRTGSDVLCGNRWRETLRISIHAPRTGSDKADDFPALVVRISIHAPRTGSDADDLRSRIRKRGFQSTLPARGATTSATRPHPRHAFQSTLPARGATRAAGYSAAPSSFQSTLPARGATL